MTPIARKHFNIANPDIKAAKSDFIHSFFRLIEGYLTPVTFCMFRLLSLT